MRFDRCVACVRTVGWVGLGINLALAFMKALVGLVSGSQAMLVDTMYSVKDVITSLLVIVGLSVSDKPLDEDHPYGHGKIEFVLSLVISVVFLVITGYLLVHTVQILLRPEEHKAPHLVALWAALVAVAVNLFMNRYAGCVAIETNSPMVHTLARHSHSDAVTSGMVAGGIVGAHYLGMTWLDVAIAIFETFDLLYLGVWIFWEACKGLMDRSVHEPMRGHILAIARATPGVVAVPQFRSRHVGQEIWGDMVLAVDPHLSVAEAHRLCETVKESVSSRVPHLGALHIRATGGHKHEQKHAHEKTAPVAEDELRAVLTGK
ncbi:MAG: Co/Zn/Cd cation transporter [Rhodospirillaceae bacterium]|nr:MAG: Co/Zn/Cd cation transporter [Rhodospirillaceae bacterium]